MMNQTLVLNFSSFLQQTHEKLISPLFISTLIIIILATTILYSLHKNRNRHGLAYSYPLLGMHLSAFYALSTNNIHEWFTKTLNQNNGTFIYNGPGFNNDVVTSNPQNMEYLLKTHFSNFVKGEYLRTNFDDLLGDGIFNADGDSWLRQRKTSSVKFHSAEFRNLTTESLLELVHSRLIPVLEEKAKDESGSGSFDLQEILLRLTFDSVCMIAFGVDPGCLNLGLADVPFARAFEGATEAIYLRLYVPVFVREIMKFFSLGWERKLKRLIQEVDEFAEEVISKRMKELNMGTDKKSRSDILTICMGLKDDEGKPYSNKFLRDICVNFILAGRDTSSVALTWFFWLLDQNPVVEERILEELCQIVAEKREEDRNDVVFTEVEVKKMDYLLAAISESLRLYPSVPLNQKEIWIGGLIETFDSCMTPIDVKVMEALGCGVKVLEEYHLCVRRVNEPTFLIMFNLDYIAIRNFLLANWCPSHLNKMVMLTGSYQANLVEIMRRMSESSHDETAELVQSIIECVTEFNFYGRCPKKGYRIRSTNQFKVTSKNKKWPFHFKHPDINKCPFRNLTWHFFNLLPDEVYQLEALLPETKLETMRRLRDGEEKDVVKILYEDRIRLCLRQMSCDENLLHKRELFPAEVLKGNFDLLRYPSRPSKRKWCPPSTGWIKLNFSAVSSAVFENNQVVGYGGVFCNENEECLHRYTGSLLEHHDEIDVALDDLDFGNAEALRKGLRYFTDMLSTRTRSTTDGRKLVIEGDSLSIVRWANGIYPPPKRLVEVFKEIHVLMCGFRCMIFHVYPEANSMAIGIANQGVMCMA